MLERGLTLRKLSGVKSNYIISRPRPKTPKHTFSPLDKGSGEGHEKDSKKKQSTYKGVVQLKKRVLSVYLVPV